MKPIHAHKVSPLDLWITPSVVFTRCDICGHLRQGATPANLGAEPMLVCPECFELIVNIQVHIWEYCKAGDGKTHQEIRTEMKRYGIPEDLTEQIRVWMVSTGALCDSEGCAP